ncbi:hypothetical protein DEU56DRAFT_947108 [Suillus clintonianus]|uniref:uncharacterized protein n=1 Tax=Suillus clintonianus TaxID=1904413 RepID=UPI001B87A8F1|nr:uncharacterized protein DEU56DRAFT_947108 [Suillus clintonianus]KAG2136420.1 hypothetical protein DEU56DRAFT_947108 [Suillus clintonianus]
MYNNEMRSVWTKLPRKAIMQKRSPSPISASSTTTSSRDSKLSPRSNSTLANAKMDKFEWSLKAYGEAKATWRWKFTAQEGEIEGLKATNAKLTPQLVTSRRPTQGDSKTLLSRTVNAEKRPVVVHNQLLLSEEKISNMNQKTTTTDLKWEARVKEYEARSKAGEEKYKRERQGAKQKVLELENRMRSPDSDNDNVPAHPQAIVDPPIEEPSLPLPSPPPIVPGDCPGLLCSGPSTSHALRFHPFILRASNRDFPEHFSAQCIYVESAQSPHLTSSNASSPPAPLSTSQPVPTVQTRIDRRFHQPATQAHHLPHLPAAPSQHFSPRSITSSSASSSNQSDSKSCLCRKNRSMGIASIEAFISPIPAYTDEEDGATGHEENLTHIVGDRGLVCLLVICDDDGTAFSTPDATTYIFSVMPTMVLLIGSLAGSRPSSVLLTFMGVSCFASLWISTNTVLHSHPTDLENIATWLVFCASAIRSLSSRMYSSPQNISNPLLRLTSLNESTVSYLTYIKKPTPSPSPSATPSYLDTSHSDAHRADILSYVLAQALASTPLVREAAAANKVWVDLVNCPAKTTRRQSKDALRCFSDPLEQIEAMDTEPPVETYAWETMPESLKPASPTHLAQSRSGFGAQSYYSTIERDA